MITLDEALDRIAILEARVIDSEARVAFLQREFDQTLAALALAGEYAGRDLTPPVSEPDRPMGELLAFPAGRVPRKRAAGGAARVTPGVAPCRVSTLGSAS